MIDNRSQVQITIDQKFLYSLRPENIVRIGIFFFLIALLLAPIQLTGNLTFKAFSYIFLCLSGFFLGCRVIQFKGEKIPQVLTFEVDRIHLLKFYRLSFNFAILGVICKFVDVFFIRGVSFSMSTLENQDALSEGGGTVLSIISAILIFTTYLPITVDYLARGLNSKRKKMVSVLIFGSNLLDCLSTGSRFSLIRPLIYFILLLALTGSFRKYSVKKIFLLGSLGVIILGNIVGAMFIRRLQDINMDEVVKVAAENGGYAQNVPASKPYQDLMLNSKEKWYYPYLFTYINVTQYITHAVFEFPDVMNYVDKKEGILYGKSTFFVYFKFLNKFVGQTGDVMEEVSKYNLRPGIWSTFFFSWYLDFGWAGILLFAFVGIIAKKIWAEAFFRHKISYIPLTLFLTLIWFLLLQLNYIQGSGTYAITIFAAIAVFWKQGAITDIRKHYQLQTANEKL